MIELLMCISLICLDADVWLKYVQYPNDTIHIQETQTVTDVIVFEDYTRYWTTFENNYPRHCYSEYDARKYINSSF